MLLNMEAAMKSLANLHSTETGRAIPALRMAQIILGSRHPLANMRGIVLVLDQAGFSNKDVRRHKDEAIAKARLMKGLTSW